MEKLSWGQLAPIRGELLSNVGLEAILLGNKLRGFVLADLPCAESLLWVLVGMGLLEVRQVPAADPPELRFRWTRGAVALQMSAVCHGAKWAQADDEEGDLRSEIVRCSDG